MRLLILDDDLLFGRALKRQFTQMNLSWGIVSSVFAAMQRLETEYFDGVLIDHRLGTGPTGLQLLRFISARFPHLNRVLMSGEEVSDWQSVAQALLHKPFSAEDLFAAFKPRG